VHAAESLLPIWTSTAAASATCVSEQPASIQVAYLHIPEWDPAENSKIDEIQADLGYFKNAKWPA
jgi:hypothetical protein